MLTPSIRLVAWGSRDPSMVFVRVPNEKGRYVLTDRCVIEVPCSACNTVIGEPCKNPQSGRYWCGTHFQRRKRATRLCG